MSTSLHSSGAAPAWPTRRPAFALALSLATVLALGACGKTDDGKTVGQKVDAALEKTSKAAAEAKAKTESAMKNAADKGEAASKNLAGKAEDKLDDLGITAAVNAGLANDTDLSALKINVDTKNGVVVLKGTAPTAAARDRATEISKGVKGVATVDNQLVVKPS